MGDHPHIAKARPHISARGELAAVAALTAAAALLRFWRIGHQSYWLDEAFTVHIVSGSFGHAMSTVPRTESTPPLYYALAWAWSKLFGTGEAGLRSLSAVIGTAAVPLAWRTARALFAPRVGVVAAALVAVNPYFVWYSQEARAYSLLVTLAALSLLATVAAVRRPTARAFALWALAAALALLTHYFAVFLLVGEAAWLLWATRRRAALGACAGVAAVGAALLPLALHQRSHGFTNFISSLALGPRVVSLPKKLVTGELGTPTPAIGPLAGVVAVAAVGYALTRAGRWRANELLLLALAVTTVAIPLVLALAGSDYLLPRNVIALYLPLALAVAAGLGAAGRLGALGAALLCALAVAVDIEVAYNPSIQRDDWRGAARASRAAAQPAAFVVTSQPQLVPLELYGGALAPVPPAGARVRDIEVIGNERPPRFPDPPAPPGFALAYRRVTQSWELVRFTAPHPTPVTAAALAASRLGPKPPALGLRR